MNESDVILELPRVLANLVGTREFAGNGDTLGALLEDLCARDPGLRAHLFDEAGKVRTHIRFVKNDEFWRSRDPLAMPLAAGDHISVINSVSGGSDELYKTDLTTRLKHIK